MRNQSASPSSTLPPAPPLLTPVSSTGYVTEGSAAGLSYAGDHHGAASPRSISGSTTSTAYASNIPPRTISPHNQKSMALQSASSDLVRVPVTHNPHESSSHWPGGQHHMQSSQQYQQLGGQNPRNSWDMSPYLDNTQASGSTSANAIQSQAGGQVQNLNYSNPTNIADNAGVGSSADNSCGRMARSLSLQHLSHQMPRT